MRLRGTLKGIIESPKLSSGRERKTFFRNLLEVISKPRSPFDRLRANGDSLQTTGILPFVLSLSKHGLSFEIASRKPDKPDQSKGE